MNAHRAILLLLPVLLAAVEPVLTVGGAASLETALDDCLAVHGAGRGTYAASSLIAQQVEAGAPIDVVVLADRAWVEWLARRGRLVEGTCAVVATNRLLLVAPAGSEGVATIRPGDPIPSCLRGRWTTGDPAHVPLGRYARAALASLGWWEDAAPTLLAARDARAAMRLLDAGEADAAIVYASDARDPQRLTVLGAFPAGGHPTIAYVAAAVEPASPAARAFLDFLRGARGQGILAARGLGAP
jgi:molybdate transport system substrate-binding protein